MTTMNDTVHEALKNEVLATYTAYLKAFNASDIHALDNFMQYPIAYIENNRAALVDVYPYNPADLKAAKQWYATTDANFEVVFATTEKAHVVLRSAKRVRADGSLIENVSVFYALTRTLSGWKFIAISDITEPA